MNNLLRLCLATLMLVVLAGVLPLQAQRPNGDPVYYYPPPLAATNGKAFIGMQNGTILYAVPSGDTILVTDSATAGARLPGNVDGIWCLATPNVKAFPNLVVGLVSVGVGPTRAYAFVRSTDLGETWSLVTSPAFSDAAFAVSNDYWATKSLQQMTWLPDAQHGWIFGSGGIVATSDGGMTWVKKASYSADGIGLVRAMAFQDDTLGVYVRGPFNPVRYGISTTSGDTFELRGSPQGTMRVLQIDYVGGQFRSLVIDRAAQNGGLTTYIGRSTNPYFLKDSLKVKAYITREQTYMTDIMWPDPKVGFMVLRSGEIWHSEDAGVTWQPFRLADSASYPMPIGGSTGFGYNSAILDNRHMIHVSTRQANGAIYRLYSWPVSIDTRVRDEATEARVVSVRPNPAAYEAELRFDRPIGPGATLSLVNVMGRTVRTFGALTSGTNAAHLDFSGLPSGSYWVELRDGARRSTVPVIVR